MLELETPYSLTLSISLGVQELYDPSIWGKQSFYEELAKVQKEDMERREKERKERTKVSRTLREGTHQGKPYTERGNTLRRAER